MAKRKPKRRSSICTAEVVEVHNPRHGSGGEAAAKRKDLCGMLRKTGGPFKRVIHSWTVFERAQGGFGGLGASTQVHLDRAAQLEARAGHELELAAKAVGCDHRVTLALEALTLATLASAHVDGDSIRRPEAFDRGGRYIGHEAEEPFKTADRHFARTDAIVSAAHGIILGCTKSGPR